MAGLSVNLTNQLYKNTYYKYRSLKDFERFLDIVVNQRLYGATYRELNDPMEGKFNRLGLNKDDFEIIYNRLHVTRICSLLTKQVSQQFPNDYLMWSHYADSHNGCCLELEITKRHNQGWELHGVKYQDTPPVFTKPIKDGTIHTILSVKTLLWKDEHEVRAIRIYEDKDKFGSLSKFYHVIIKAIYFGCRVSKEKRDFYKKIITKTNPEINLYYLKETSAGPNFFPTLKPIPMFIDGKSIFEKYTFVMKDSKSKSS